MKTLKQILLFCCTILVLLACYEVMLTFGEVIPPKYREVDNEIGLRFLSNKNVTRFNEGFFIGSTNSQGNLGPTVNLVNKPPNEKRVALMGDSYVVGQQVFYRQHFAQQTENLLNNSHQENFKLLNFGMNGYQLADMYVRYKNLVERYQPDLTLFFVAPEDLSYTSAGLNPKIDLIDNELIIENQFSKSESKGVKAKIEELRLWSMLSACKSLIAKKQASSILFGKFAADNSVNESNHVKNSETLTLDHPSLDLITMKVVEQLSKSKNVAVVLLKPISTVDLNQIKLSGIPIIDLAPAINLVKKREINPVYWSATKKTGHYNHYVHKEMSVILDEEISKLLQP